MISVASERITIITLIVVSLFNNALVAKPTDTTLKSHAFDTKLIRSTSSTHNVSFPASTIAAIMSNSSFPKNLIDFGYDFDEDGKLRKLDSPTEGFEFNVSEDPQYNQKRYEALGEVINQHIYELLEKEGLKRIPVPKESKSSELQSFVFACDQAFTNKKLLVLIHGSGVVRAGQWARRLIINDNLKSGTQIPYIRKAKELGYGVIVLNTNDNRRIINGVPKEIPGSENPHSHMQTVWSDYIKASAAEDIAIVAHSYGGVCTMKFAADNAEEFRKRVFAVGFTDSVHVMPAKSIRDYLVGIGRNWVSSERPLDASVDCASDDVPCVSAGHPVHEMTSWSCIESLFKFLEERYHERIRGKEYIQEL